MATLRGTMTDPDIVKRLRRMADMTTTGNDLGDIAKAADEIERLRTELAAWHWVSNILVSHGITAIELPPRYETTPPPVNTVAKGPDELPWWAREQ